MFPPTQQSKRNLHLLFEFHSLILIIRNVREKWQLCKGRSTQVFPFLFFFVNAVRKKNNKNGEWLPLHRYVRHYYAPYLNSFLIEK